MKQELRFRPGTLRMAAERWLVDGAIKCPTYRDGWCAEDLSGIGVTSPIADWLRDVHRALLFHVTSENLDYARSRVSTEFLWVEVDENLNVSRVYPNIIVPKSVNPGPASYQAPSNDQFADLRDFAEEARDVIAASVWAELRCNCPDPDFVLPPDHGLVGSHGMCRVTALSALPLLKEAFPDGRWRMVGGHPSILYGQDFPSGTFAPDLQGWDGGMWSERSHLWHGHYWVEGMSAGERVIVDLTADQFGWSPVVVTYGADERYRANFSEAKIQSMSDDPIIESLVRLVPNEWARRQGMSLGR